MKLKDFVAREYMNFRDQLGVSKHVWPSAGAGGWFLRSRRYKIKDREALDQLEKYMLDRGYPVKIKKGK
jgi:hypothetical protein